MITTDQSLLFAICAAPEDDLPRLAYADWCEEQGDTPRAEFVRVQLELATLEAIPHTCAHDDYWESTCPACGVYCVLDDLRTREQDLLRAWYFDFTRNLPGPTLPHGCDTENAGVFLSSVDNHHRMAVQFHRGFVASLTLNTADFLANACDWFRSCPIEEVILTGIPALRHLILVRYAVHKGRWRDHLRDIQIANPDDLHRQLCLLSSITQETTGKVYDSKRDADNAISRACVAFGREQARRTP